MTAIRALSGDRLTVFVGVDDAIVEGIYAGAVGWVAGLAVLANAAVFSCYNGWHGGSSYGPRYFVDVLPWFVLATAVAVRALLDAPSAGFPWKKLPAVAFAAEAKVELGAKSDSIRGGVVVMGMDRAAIYLRRNGEDVGIHY